MENKITFGFIYALIGTATNSRALDSSYDYGTGFSNRPQRDTCNDLAFSTLLSLCRPCLLNFPFCFPFDIAILVIIRPSAVCELLFFRLLSARRFPCGTRMAP